MSGILVFDIETKCVMDNPSARKVNVGKKIPMVFDGSIVDLGVLKIGYVFGEDLDALKRAEVVLCGVEDIREVWKQCDHIVGYNLQFDFSLLNVYGMSELGKKATDLYFLLISKIYGYSYNIRGVGGRRMGQVAVANGMDDKSGNILKLMHAMYSGDNEAYEDIKKYLIQDVKITANLLRRAMVDGFLVDPKTKEKVYF